METNRSRISVAVEKCQLCCYSRRPMICFNCIKSGNFSHSADEFIAENYYVNKRKLWLKKKSETNELKERCTKCLEKDRIQKEKLLKIQRLRLNVMVAKEAYHRLQHQLTQERQAYEELKAINVTTGREIITIKTKIKNILEHLKRQPEKQEMLCAKLQASKAELAECRKRLCTEMVEKVFPICHSNDWNPLQGHKGLSEEEFKQLSIYLSKNNFQPPIPHNLPLTPLLELTTNNTTTATNSNSSSNSSNRSSHSSNITITDSSPSQQPSTKHHPHHSSHHPTSPPLTTSLSNPTINPSSESHPTTSHNQPQPTSTSSPTTPLETTTSNQSNNPPTKSISHPKSSPFSYQFLNSSAINLLKEARMTAFIDGKWVYSTEHEDSPLQIIHTSLPSNIRLYLRHKHPHSTADIKAGLSLLTQLTTLLAHILDCSLPRSVHFREFSGELTVRQLTRRLSRLESNVHWMCHNQNLPSSMHPLHPLRSIHSLLKSPQLGCDEANSVGLLEGDEEGLWIVEGSGRQVYKGGDDDDDDDDEENDDDDDEGDESEVIMMERLSRLPQRKGSYPGNRYKHKYRNRNNSENSGSNGEGNWEYISPHVELIPEQTLSSSLVSSSDTIGASVGAYVSSWIHAWRG